MKWRLAAAAATITLAGCAGAPPVPTDLPQDDSWSVRREALSGIDTWNIRGRLAVQTADRAESVTFVWRREARHHEIEMFGAFGGGRVRMTEEPGKATFVDRKGATMSGGSAEALFFEQTGWRIPFDAIVYWVVGLPDPDHPYDFDLDTLGRLTRVTQLGWQVNFIDNTALGAYDLPGKIFAERSADGANTGELAKVKLAVKSWQIPGIGADNDPPAETAPRGN